MAAKIENSESSGRIYRFLESSSLAPNTAQTRFWLALSLLATLVPAIVNLRRAFDGPYTIAYDAGKHLYWMQKFTDPSLFPGDLVTDFYASLTPLGLRGLYWLTAQVGLDYATTTKLMAALLAVVATYYAFRLCFYLLPSATGAFIGATWLTVFLWLQRSTSGGSPRGYAIPLFVVFLYFLARRSTIGTVTALALQAACYPLIALISCGVLVLSTFIWREGGPHWRVPRRDLVRTMAGLVVVAAILVVYRSDSQEYGPALTLATVEALDRVYYEQPGKPFLEQRLTGLSNLLCGKLHKFIPLAGSCRGVWRRSDPLPIWPITTIVFLLAGPLFLIWLSRRSGWSEPRREVQILLGVWLASAAWFAAANAFPYHLYAPGRFMQFSIKPTVAITLGVLSAVALRHVLRSVREWAGSVRLIGAGAAMLFTVTALAGPAYWLFERRTLVPVQGYMKSGDTALYEFLTAQPPDALTASMSFRVHAVPVFGFRPAFFAFPFHWLTGYWQAYHERAAQLFEAQYAPDLARLRALTGSHGIDFVLLDRNWETPEYVREGWWQYFYPEDARRVVHFLEQGGRPALTAHVRQCSVLENKRYDLVDVDCVLGGGSVPGASGHDAGAPVEGSN